MKTSYQRENPFLFLMALVMLLLGSISGCAQNQVPVPAQESNTQVQITGCYSNLFLHEESGDILGWEFFIVYSGDAYHVLYQESEGWPTVLLLLPVTVEGNAISFVIPRDNGERLDTFHGTITEDDLTGFFGTGAMITLPRQNSFWQ